MPWESFPREKSRGLIEAFGDCLLFGKVESFPREKSRGLIEAPFAPGFISPR
jgi:hypothetical protein